MDLDETWQVGLRPEKTKPCTFPAKSCYGFRRERKKMGCRSVVFCDMKPCTTFATFLGSISAKLSTNTCPGGGSRHVVSHSRKVSIQGSNLPESPLFRVPYRICDQATHHGKRSVTSTLCPSPGGHPTGDFCWDMYHFPAIHIWTFPFATVSATAKRGCLYFCQTYSPGGTTIGSPICTGTLHQCTFSSSFCVGCCFRCSIFRELLRFAACTIWVVRCWFCWWKYPNWYTDYRQ